MALNRWISSIRTSLRGERLGLDDGEFLVAPKGYREPFESLSAAATMENCGVTVLTGSTATFTLQAPGRAGITKEIINASSVSTAQMAIVRSTANGGCTFLSLSSAFGSSGDQTIVRVNLTNVGAFVKLRAISTSQWAAVGIGSSANYAVSTSS